MREWRVLPSDSTSCWVGQLAYHVGPRSLEMDNLFLCKSCSGGRLVDPMSDHPPVHKRA